jgi:hypothetical protein
VVVLGPDLGATVAGAVLAHRGFRVLLAGAPTEERYAVGPYMLPRAPAVLVGLESPSLKRLTAELNLVQLLRRRLEPNRPAYQLILPDARLDADADWVREVARESPDAVGPLEQVNLRLREVSSLVESILAQDLILPADGFWDRRDATRVGARLPADDGDPQSDLPAGHPLRALSGLPAAFGADLAPLGQIPMARLADLHRQGTHRLDGGRQALRALLVDRLRTHSGEVRPELVPLAIQTKRGKISAVLFEGAEGTVNCSHVLCGLPAARVADMLDEKPPKRLVEAAALAPAYHRYLLHLVAPLDALPDALARLAFAVDDPNAPLTDGNALCLHNTDGYGQHAVLSVEALVSDTAPTHLAEVRRKIRAHLNRFLPYVDRHLLLVHSPHDGLPAQGEDRETPTLPPPVPLDPVWRIPPPRPLGFCGLPHQTGVKNLLLCSRQVLPGLGLEGELHAGWCAARLVLMTEKKRDLVVGEVLAGS